jgi:CRISPR-associated protein Csm3
MTNTVLTPIFKANIILKGKIECLTGLHIGGSKEKLEIGGVDSPVLRNPQTNYPYIPGSSLKGKLRHLLEFATGAVSNPIKEFGDVSKSEHIVRLFGIGADDKGKAQKQQDDKDAYLANIGLTRLIIRDCNPDKYTTNMWKNLDSELLYTEYKPENTIDRLTSAANPRFIERVVAGSRFDFEIVYGVYQMQDETDFTEKVNTDLENITTALRLLESNFLGKSGSRGYGQVKFHFETTQVVKTSDYQGNTDAYKSANKAVKNDLVGLQQLSEITLSYAN